MSRQDREERVCHALTEESARLLDRIVRNREAVWNDTQVIALATVLLEKLEYATWEAIYRSSSKPNEEEPRDE